MMTKSMDREKILVKIENLMKLAKDAGTPEESINAMGKAQAIMMKYKIEERELGTVQEKKTAYMILAKHTYSKCHRIRLGKVIAENFNCVLVESKKKLYLFGLEQDVDIATTVFNATCYIMHRKADNLARRMKEHSHYGSYMDGYIDGLKAKFEKQKAENQEWGLILVKDKAVTDEVAKMTSKASTSKMNYGKREEAYANGYKEGHSYNHGREIEG